MSQKSKVVRLSEGAVAWVEAAREAIKRHDGGVVCELRERADDDALPSVRLVPVDSAGDAAVIAHCLAHFVRWSDPETRDAAKAADEARAAFIRDLQDAWRAAK